MNSPHPPIQIALRALSSIANNPYAQSEDVNCAKAAIAAMGESTGRGSAKEEGHLASDSSRLIGNEGSNPSSPANHVRCEIRLKKANEMTGHEQRALFGQVISQPKPVSVDLEKCKKALCPHIALYHYSDYGLSIVKAVLDAAGVKYVE